MSDSKTTITAPKSAFTTSSGVVNASSFHQELTDLVPPLSVAVESVREVATDVKVVLDGLATTDDKAAIDAAITVHSGDSFKDSYQGSSVAEDVLKGEDPIEAPDGTPVEVYSHESGTLRKGDYQVFCSAEHKVDQEVVGDDSEISVQVDLGGGYLEMNSDSVQSQKFRSFSNGMVIPREDGQEIKVKMFLKKTGSGDAKAVLRRARIVHFQLFHN